jgi:hypothetical protein
VTMKDPGAALRRSSGHGPGRLHYKRTSRYRPGEQQLRRHGVIPEQRRLRAQIAANTRWSRPMAREDAADTARSAFYARLERQVDPQGKLQPGERDRLVRAGARAFSARLNSAKSRKQRPEPSALYIRQNQCPCRQPRQGR